jgi:uncharacterized protein YgiB involved in biofilm formation
MSEPVSSRRKRSAAAGLTAAGALAMLSGCDPSPSIEQAARERDGPPTEVSAFQSVPECVASGAFSQVQCEEAERTAANDDNRTAPRFADKETCEEQFGAAQCQPRREGSSSFFTPLLTGFMIGQLMNGGGGYRYQGLYRNGRDGNYYTGSGAALYRGNGGGRYQVGSRALTNPVTTQRIQTRSSVVSRGGFGGRASARGGGWGGGGRSFGG